MAVDFLAPLRSAKKPLHSTLCHGGFSLFRGSLPPFGFPALRVAPVASHLQGVSDLCRNRMALSADDESGFEPMNLIGCESGRTQRWKVWCAYEGTSFNGWQSQKDGGAIQDYIEARLGAVFGRPIRIHGAGRTDAGVHAEAQVFHFDAGWSHGGQKLLRALRVGVPAGIRIWRVSRVDSTFHARFSATGKRYRYNLFEGTPMPWEARHCWAFRRRLDDEAMRVAAQFCLGEHDFTAFGANHGDGSGENPVKRIWRMDVFRDGRRLRFTTEGSGYLYKMVRLMTGVLVDVGLGKRDPEVVAAMLQSGERPVGVQTAPAQGLWLERVFYS